MIANKKPTKLRSIPRIVALPKLRLPEEKIKVNDVLLNSFLDKTLKSEEYQEKICSECIWHRKNH